MTLTCPCGGPVRTAVTGRYCPRCRRSWDWLHTTDGDRSQEGDGR